MWVKLIVGAGIGLIIGHFAPPGYAIWVILGVIVGYLVNYQLVKDEERKKDIAKE